jgi:hypothetical protein
MNLFRRLTNAALMAAVLTISAPAEAAYISIIGTPYIFGDNLNVSISSDRLSITDFFDQYAETPWSVASVTEDSTGTVHVTYAWGPEGLHSRTDPYGAWTQLQFQILPESGTLTHEVVAVDVYGMSFYRNLRNGGCCVVDPQYVTLSAGADRYYSAEQNTFLPFEESLLLLTNTPYNLDYLNVQYVEGYPQGGQLPQRFQSRALYESWVAQNGTSGTIYASSFGFMNWNLAVRPTSVAEPGTLSLLIFGLITLGIVKRRRRSMLCSLRSGA